MGSNNFIWRVVYGLSYDIIIIKKKNCFTSLVKRQYVLYTPPNTNVWCLSYGNTNIAKYCEILAKVNLYIFIQNDITENKTLPLFGVETFVSNVFYKWRKTLILFIC